MDVNYRLPLPPRETFKEALARTKKERQHADAFIRFRMDVISETYGLPLKDLFLTKAYKEFLKRCGTELKELQDKQSEISAPDRYFKVDAQGEVSPDDLFDEPEKALPEHFYRTTKLASWKVYRHHHLKYGHQPSSGSYRQVSFTRPLVRHAEHPPFLEYLHMVAEMMTTTKAKELQLLGQSRRGSFLMLSPYEKSTFRKQIESGLIKGTPLSPHRIRRFDVPHVKRMADKLTEVKLEEAEAQGKKVSFKGRGDPKRSSQSQSGSRKTSRGSPRHSGRTSRTEPQPDLESVLPPEEE